MNYERYTSTHPGLSTEFSQEDFDQTAQGYYKIYAAYLPQDRKAKILDVGCGQGHFLYLLRKLGYENIYGVDVSEEQIEFCSKYITKKVTACNAFDFLKNKTGEYGLVAMNDVLEHIPKQNIIPFLNLVHDSLTQHGSVIVKVPNQENPFSLYTRYLDFTHEIGFTSGSLYQVLSMTGFRNIRVYPYRIEARGLKSWIKQMLRRVVLRAIAALFEIPDRELGRNLRIQCSKHIFAVANP